MKQLPRSGLAVLSVLALALMAPGARAEPARVYIGTFTADPADPSTRSNHGEGIYLADMDARTGALSNARLAARSLSPSWIILSPDARFLYSVNEIATHGEKKSGTITSYAVDRASGALTELNSVDSEAAIPTYISLHPSGKFLMVADYIGGAFAAFPVKPDGSLGAASDVVRPSGPQMPNIAADSPPGNFVRSDHRGPRGHMIHADPSGQFVVADDAGLDRIMTFRFDTAAGKFSQIASYQSAPGSAPRHFVFAPDGKRLYQIQEQDSILSVYDFNPANGELTLLQKLSALAPGFAGTSASSELLIDRGGHYLYSANRMHDSITTFAIGADGKAAWRGTEATQGDWPRSLALDPSGRFLYSQNQRGDNVVTFRIDPATGLPHPTGNFLPIPSAASMVFLP